MSSLMGPGALALPLYSGTAPMKVEDGTAYPKAAYAYTPDDVPSHWKLRLWESPHKKVTAHQVGMAVAALGKGFRGQKVSIPRADLPAVKRRVLRAWHEANPGKKDLPDVLRHLDASDDEAVAPPGWEHTVKQMKKSGEIDNPWAIAWWMKNRGATPTHAHEMCASSDTERLMRQLIRQQHQIPDLCLKAAQGESWAQALLLTPGCPPLVVDGRY